MTYHDKDLSGYFFSETNSFSFYFFKIQILKIKTEIR
jgi:hypothetical protein